MTTIAAALRATAKEHGDALAVRTADDSVRLTWSDLVKEVDRAAGGFNRLGVQRGETVALLMGNRPEFHIADLGVVTAGGAPFSIYQTYTPEQISYVVGDAGSKIAVVSAEYLDVMSAAKELTPCLETIILIDGPAPDTISWEDMLASGDGFDGDTAAAAVLEDDLLTLIYTSGTTGPPKGVELTNVNIRTLVGPVASKVGLEQGERVISWLPAAHIAERGAHHYIPVVYGASITCCPDPRQITQFLPQVHPHWFFAVPRIWEKLKAGLEAMLAAQPAEQAKPLVDALADSVAAVKLRQAGETVQAELQERVDQADREIFSGLRAMLGLDEVRAVSVGAAPTPREVLEFFHAIGIEVAEVFGLSETAGVATMNPPGAVRIGTVGPPVEGAEIVLADDGEVLIRGPLIMKGYRNKPEATAEAINAEGWFHTGDIGQFDEAGYLKIVDRKKELIINAAGKNMSPANIEAAVKSSSPLIGQACAIGDARPFNTALIVLDPDVAPTWAAQHGLEGADIASLSENAELIAEVEAAIERANSHLARVEQIKKFTILPVDWLPGGDELTPTMKLKRKPIAEKYSAQIEALYS
jgi:long-subunit acyl-CoA synthetase (AMP-forming)